MVLQTGNSTGVQSVNEGHHRTTRCQLSASNIKKLAIKMVWTHKMIQAFNNVDCKCTANRTLQTKDP